VCEASAAPPAKEKPFETDVLAKETHFRRLARIDRDFVGKVEGFDSAQRVVSGVVLRQKWQTIWR
jgi:hypothetical protein